MSIVHIVVVDVLIARSLKKVGAKASYTGNIQIRGQRFIFVLDLYAQSNAHSCSSFHDALPFV